MTSPTQSAMEQQQREAFMTWVRDRGCDTDGAWSAWQACSAEHASELRSLRDSLALARSHIGELRDLLSELADTASGSVELDDWPELQASLANARAALNKEKP